jgi:hypothetical protein
MSLRMISLASLNLVFPQGSDGIIGLTHHRHDKHRPGYRKRGLLCRYCDDFHLAESLPKPSYTLITGSDETVICSADRATRHREARGMYQVDPDSATEGGRAK